MTTGGQQQLDVPQLVLDAVERCQDLSLAKTLSVPADPPLSENARLRLDHSPSPLKRF